MAEEEEIVEDHLVLTSTYFYRGYQKFELLLDDIGDYVPLTSNQTAPNYRFGSFKFCDFGTSIGNYVDTCFSKLKEVPFLDKVEGYSILKGNNTAIRKFIIKLFQLEKKVLLLRDMSTIIYPFREMTTDAPSILDKNSCWYWKYSRHKHDIEKLLNCWTLRDCVYSLGCAFYLSIICIQIAYNDRIWDLKGLSHHFFNNPMSLGNTTDGWLVIADTYTRVPIGNI